MSDHLKPIEPADTIDADQIVEFVALHFQRSVTGRLPWHIAYEWYSDFWADGPGTAKPLSAAEFGAALAYVCERAGIPIKRRGTRVYCLGVRLIDPDVKALPAPDG